MTEPTPKQQLLNELKSNGKNKYKRYQPLPLRYAGGKSLAVGHIVEHLPEGIKKIVSPFFGGGAVEIACNQKLNIEIEAYDIFEILCIYWQRQIKTPQKLANKIAEWPINKETYNEIKTTLKQFWNLEEPLNDLEVAAHYWYNHNLSYGPGFLGWMSKIYENEKRVHNMINKVKNFKTNKITIEEETYQRSLPPNQNEYAYCDPPYYLDGTSKMFKGIYPQRNFPIHHKNFDHKTLCEILHNHQGGFLLSYNDCEEIRKMYADYTIKEIEWQYTMGQGETRIGKNRQQNKQTHIKQSHELLIIKN